MAYPDTYYARTIAAAPERPALGRDLHADVCVVGAGLAGLTTALELARAGRAVVLVDADRIAWGASGRNGGFVSSGFACSMAAVAARVGADHARALFDLSVDGVEYVRGTISALGLADAQISEAGCLGVIRYDDRDGLLRQRDAAFTDYGETLEYWSQARIAQNLSSTCYHHGLFDARAFQFHPLNYAQGLAAEFERLGGLVFEETAVRSVVSGTRPHEVIADGGKVTADHVVIACGGYTGPQFETLHRAILPVATYVMLTEPLGDRRHQAIRTEAAIFDDRWAADYYRVVDGDRLLWGGHITTATREPRRLAERLYRDMVAVYPQLDGVRVEAAWSGLMSYALHRMPQIGRLPDGLWYAQAFGGHGMNTAAVAGQLIAGAIAAGDDRWRLFEPFGLDRTWGPLGRAGVQATYWAYQLRDWWQERGAGQ